jgi:hypothetical protein
MDIEQQPGPVQFTDAQLEEIQKRIGAALATERQIHTIESDNLKRVYLERLSAQRGGETVDGFIARAQVQEQKDARDIAYLSQVFGSKSNAAMANEMAKTQPEQYQRLKVEARRLKLIA